MSVGFDIDAPVWFWLLAVVGLVRLLHLAYIGVRHLVRMVKRV